MNNIAISIWKFNFILKFNTLTISIQTIFVFSLAIIKKTVDKVATLPKKTWKYLEFDNLGKKDLEFGNF